MMFVDLIISVDNLRFNEVELQKPDIFIFFIFFILSSSNFQVLDALGDCLVHVFDSLNAHFATELAIVGKQYPYEPLQYPRKTLVIHFPEAVQMIRDSGMAMGDFDDFSYVYKLYLLL